MTSVDGEDEELRLEGRRKVRVSEKKTYVMVQVNKSTGLDI